MSLHILSLQTQSFTTSEQTTTVLVGHMAHNISLHQSKQPQFLLDIAMAHNIFVKLSSLHLSIVAYFLSLKIVARRIPLSALSLARISSSSSAINKPNFVQIAAASATCFQYPAGQSSGYPGTGSMAGAAGLPPSTFGTTATAAGILIAFAAANQGNPNLFGWAPTGSGDSMWTTP